MFQETFHSLKNQARSPSFEIRKMFTGKEIRAKKERASHIITTLIQLVFNFMSMAEEFKLSYYMNLMMKTVLVQ